MPIIKLDGKDYNVAENEFPITPHQEYNNLILKDDVGIIEREAGLLNDIATDIKKGDLHVIGWSHGGFLPVECAESFNTIFVEGMSFDEKTSCKNIIPVTRAPSNPIAVYVTPGVMPSSLLSPLVFVLAEHRIANALHHPYKFPLANSRMTLCVPALYEQLFREQFHYYFQDNGIFAYDNMINLCIMVKNAGPLFERVLTENLPIIDRWTILDTGSTDETIEIINRVLVGKKKGKLYQEPFINFRDSRNRCLELASKSCKYNVMFDDTYAIRGDLRSFLTLVRGDQFANSYSLLILSDDSEYYSNRVLKVKSNLKYIYTIHEVIQKDNNVTVVIPKDQAWIYDHRADYMEKRTMDRKQYDLKLLEDMIEEDPTNPRHLYYMAQTYNCINDFSNAAVWFEKRATSKLEGHLQEAVDSYFELGRIYNFKMNKPWSLCEETYMKSYELDPSRPDSLYFIGIHYQMEGNTDKAYEFFSKAFALGYPVHAQFSLKPTLSYHFLPKFLAPLCYQYGNMQLGYQACERFLSKAKPTDDSYKLMCDWYMIFKNLVAMSQNSATPSKGFKPRFVFVADGNWNKWTGRDILTKGLGGSETYIVELARYIQAEGTLDVTVFCRSDGTEIFEGVMYRPIEEFGAFVTNNEVHTCIVSRYTEYLPVAIRGHVENLYLVLHDLGPTGSIIPMHNKLKKIFCLTDWHVKYFLKDFPQCADRTLSFYYGIDSTRFIKKEKKPNSFIYSSYPNRGLLQLLRMWTRIKSEFPDATLDVFADINGKWVNEVAGAEMDAIRILLNRGLEGVNIRGWVSKSELADAWSTADVWFYPATFMETFCLTALEAASSGTLAITSDLAALQETVSDRGIMIPGDASTFDWHEKALNELFSVLRDPGRKAKLVERNKQWANSMSWKNRAEDMLNKYIKPTLKTSYADMYNWTHDLPAGARKYFEEALDLVKDRENINVLEIGTFVGTSLIEIMKRLGPNTKGTAIDRWMNYEEEGIDTLKNIEKNNVEQIFWKNIINNGLKDKVTALKGDSGDMLLKLVESESRFDFIYVDGSHRCLDCYADCVIAWKLLNPDGVMAIDDYMYHYDKAVGDGVLEYPIKGVDHFLEKYKDEYRLISKGYRVFIQKLNKVKRVTVPTSTIQNILDAGEDTSIINYHYLPIKSIRNKLIGKCLSMERVLEVGPGQIPFEVATHFVDNGTSCKKDPRIIMMDINYDKFRESHNFYNFVYCRHTLEDICNPKFAFEEMTRVSEAGYIETPSPLVEILKGIEKGVSYRGYIHHRYIVWTDKNNVLNFLPKLPFIEKIIITQEFENKLMFIANNYPFYWNNYYMWDKHSGINPKVKIHNVDLDFNINDYGNLLMIAVNESFESTNRFLNDMKL
jgi:predicted O-methyltransferase YrrM/tetratricopeptide (TPR) repeat protein